MPDTITPIREGWKLSPKASHNENQHKAIKESQHSVAGTSMEKKGLHRSGRTGDVKCAIFFHCHCRETTFIWKELNNINQ